MQVPLQRPLPRGWPTSEPLMAWAALIASLCALASSSAGDGNPFVHLQSTPGKTPEKSEWVSIGWRRKSPPVAPSRSASVQARMPSNATPARHDVQVIP